MSAIWHITGDFSFEQYATLLTALGVLAETGTAKERKAALAEVQHLRSLRVPIDGPCNLGAAAEAWWKAHRPLSWTRDEHLENPTINTSGAIERALAIATASTILRKQNQEAT